MEKPTIFLSHSSSDKEYISKLNSIIKKRTANTVEVFQSSDGESIPFGNNWVHKIEENLNKTKIMLVFVSPKSATSSWIYFESGYAYSKGVKVIPIGIAGVDIGSIRPPLNLLQGFNISSEDGLGNLITVINREFDTSFDENFESSEYSVLSVFDMGRSEAKILNHIRRVVIKLHSSVGSDSEKASIGGNTFVRIEEMLQASGVQYQKVNGDIFGPRPEISSYGLNVFFAGDTSVRVAISIESIQLYEYLINNIFSLYDQPLHRGWMEIYPSDSSNIISDSITFSARMHKQGLELAEIGHQFYSKYGFNVKMLAPGAGRAEPASLLLNYEVGGFSASKLYDLLGELVEAGVFY